MTQSLKWLALVAFGVLSLGMFSWAAERVDAGIQSRLDECTCTYCQALLSDEDTQSRALALVRALAHPRTDSEPPEQDEGEVAIEAEPSFACERQALNAEQQERHQALMGQLRSAVEEIRELPAGYEFALPALFFFVSRAGRVSKSSCGRCFRAPRDEQERRISVTDG